MSDEETTKVNELKYEGLASLIIQGQQNELLRHTEFKEFVDHRFKGIEAHNTKQNGSITDALKAIADIKKESDERKLTCMVAVEALQKKAKYTKLLWWVDNHPTKSIISFVMLLLVAQAIVHVSVANGWLGQLIGLIKGL